jgi:hypothetical protein
MFSIDKIHFVAYPSHLPMDPENGFTFRSRVAKIHDLNSLTMGRFSFSQTTRGCFEFRSDNVRYTTERKVATATPTINRVKMVHSSSRATRIKFKEALMWSEKAAAKRPWFDGIAIALGKWVLGLSGIEYSFAQLASLHYYRKVIRWLVWALAFTSQNGVNRTPGTTTFANGKQPMHNLYRHIEANPVDKRTSLSILHNFIRSHPAHHSNHKTLSRFIQYSQEVLLKAQDLTRKVMRWHIHVVGGKNWQVALPSSFNVLEYSSGWKVFLFEAITLSIRGGRAHTVGHTCHEKKNTLEML